MWRRIIGLVGGIGVLAVLAIAIYTLMVSGGDSNARSKQPMAERPVGNSGGSGFSGARLTPVQVARVETGTVREEIRQSATLASASEVPIYSQAAGLVKTVGVEEGQVVKPGEVLVRLDDEEWRLNLAQARVALARDAKEWERQRSINAKALQDRKEYRDARYTFKSKELALAQRAQERKRAESEARRMEISYRESLASEQERDQTRNQAELAGIAEDQAKLELERAREEWERVRALDAQSLIDEAAYTQAEFSYKAAKAAVDIAELKVRRAAIRSPLEGVVVKRQVEPGDFVATTQPLLTVSDLESLEAVVYLPEIHWSAVKPGQPVRVKPQALPGVEAGGSVLRVSPTLDPGTGTFKVTVILKPDSARRIVPGMFAEIVLSTATRDGAMLVPRTAVLGDQGARYVMVVESGPEGQRAQRREVRVGVNQGERVEILQGLEGDEQVVVAGQHSLKSGSPVRIRQ